MLRGSDLSPTSMRSSIRSPTVKMSAAAKRNTEVKLYLEEMMDAMCTNDKEQNERNIELLADQIYDNIKH